MLNVQDIEKVEHIAQNSHKYRFRENKVNIKIGKYLLNFVNILFLSYFLRKRAEFL